MFIITFLEPVKALDTVVYIDSLAMIHRHTRVTHLYEILLECAIRYLKLFEKKLINHIIETQDFTKISQLETFHFYSSEFGHFLTRLYPKNKTEESLSKYANLYFRNS